MNESPGRFDQVDQDVELSRRCDELSPHLVRLVADHPVGAQLAVRAVGLGHLGGAVLAREDSLFTAATDNVAAGLNVLSNGVIDLANSVQPISERQIEILLHLMEGVPYMLVARRMYLSLSTVKRELKVLRTVLVDGVDCDSQDDLRCLIETLNVGGDHS